MNNKNMPVEKKVIPPVVLDDQKKAIVPKTREETVNEKMLSLLATAGTIKITPKQKKILYEKVNPKDVEIKPTGQIYLPWGWYQTKLREVFGFEWELFPGGKANMVGRLVIREWWLIIQGKPYGNAFGECDYIANNPVMTYGDAIEGTKSNATTRLCKGLGMASELWNPTWVKNWIAEYAETYIDKGKIRWRKKDTTKKKTKTPKAPAKVSVKKDKKQGTKPAKSSPSKNKEVLPSLPETITFEQKKGNILNLRVDTYLTKEEIEFYINKGTTLDKVANELNHRFNLVPYYKPKTTEVFSELRKIRAHPEVYDWDDWKAFAKDEEFKKQKEEKQKKLIEFWKTNEHQNFTEKVTKRVEQNKED